MNVFEEAGKSEEEIRQYGEVLAETKQAAEESNPRAPPTGDGVAFSRQMHTFPPYNISKSEANELSTRWAHKKTVETGDQALVSYHNSWYIIEKFDDSDDGYMITKKVKKSEYEEIVKGIYENGKVANGSSVSEEALRIIGLDGRGLRNVGTKQGTNSISPEYGGKNTETDRMDQNKNERREFGNDGRRAYAPSSGDKPGNGIKASREITPEEDAEYLELAKDPEKNREKLEQMVEKAARKAAQEKIKAGQYKETSQDKAYKAKLAAMLSE